MTIQECYAQMGADYNEVFRRLYNEAMIRKFVLLFPKDENNAPYLPKTFTETLRAGQLEGTAEQFAEVEKQYRITMAAIQALD